MTKTEPKPTQRADGRWVLSVQVGLGSRAHRVRRYLYGSSPSEVLAKRDRLVAALDANPAPERLSVAAYLLGWVDGLAGVRPRTIESYRHTVERHLVPELGTISLQRLRATDIRKAVRSIERRIGVPTAAYAVTVLRIALNVAVRDRLLERNEAVTVTRPKVDRPEQEILDGHGLRRLLDQVHGDRLEALYVVAATLGLRRGEALGLRWRDVDLEKGTLQVTNQLMYRPGDAYELAPPKTKLSRRALYLPAIAVEALTAHRSRQRLERLAAGPNWGVPDEKGVRHSNDLVFVTATGGPLAGSTVVHALHRHLAAAGLPRQRWHDLRHAAATILAPVMDRAHFLAFFGWTEGSTPARYTHATSASKPAAAAMDQLLRRPDVDEATS